MFKSVITILLAVATYVPVQAQFGLTARYAVNSYDSDINNVDAYFGNTVEVGANYWFRLKNKRIEFLPEVYYGLSTEATINWPLGSETISQQYYGLGITTQIYLFDLENDCNCPTFSKQGPEIQKSFFVSVTPGVQRRSLTSTLQTMTATESNNAIIPYLGIGAGFDIGLSDLLTVSPYVSYRLHFAEYELPTAVEVLEPITESLSTLLVGLRFTFRPDYVKQNRY